MTDVNNYQDIIDSRDVIARIDELVEERDSYIEDNEGETPDWVEHYPDEAEELTALEELASEAEGYAPDWHHGETLIRDSYFVEYAEQLADDIGAVNSEAGWPNSHIDWDAAADDLKQDYTAVDFAGETYWIR